MSCKNTTIRIMLVVIALTTRNLFGLNAMPIPDLIVNAVYDDNIFSVQLKTVGWEFSMPVIELGSDQQLELRFDDLSGETRTFGYTLVHCDCDWHISGLPESEYMTGFTGGIIRNYSQSLNTTRFYINHHLQFPEEDAIPSVSGNYAIVVYEESDPEKIVLTRRFYVSENTSGIEAVVRRPSVGLEKNTSQQLQISVNYKSSEIRDPLSELQTVVVQNYRYDNSMVFTKPYLSRPGRLEFTDPEGGIISGGNEFRTLDIKSTRYQTENVARIDFRNPYYHILLKPDGLRSDKPWFSKADLNGEYYVDRERSTDRHTEADYVYVHFSLEIPPTYAADEIYVGGAFTNWETLPGNQLKYNPDNGLFEATLLLKQGLYDYCFLMKNATTGIADEYEIEGSYYETENDYSVFVYFKDSFNRYHRLIGFLPLK